MTVAEACDHFEQRELGKENNWRSYSTKKAYRVYLKRWIIPHWGTTALSDVRPIAVESWLRRLPLAKSSCAKIRNLFSVLFNHACRYEFFDGNPITFVRQGATRRTVPAVLTPAEIKLLLTNLGLRERTLVLLAASTGLRQSELFALQWGDIDFAQGIMSVTRSIVNGVVGCCKTESSRKPVPLHSSVCEALLQWRRICRHKKSDDWVFASGGHRGSRPYWGQVILRRYIQLVAHSIGVNKKIGWQRLSNQGQATRSTFTSLRVIHFIDTSRTPGICVLDDEAVLVVLRRIYSDQTGKALARRIDHVQVTIGPVVPSQANVGACALRVGGIHLEQS